MKFLTIYLNFRTIIIAQNIAQTCQKYFVSIIENEILSQHFRQILQNISSQHYNFNFLKYFWNKLIINSFRNIVEWFHWNVQILQILIFENVATN